VPVNPGADAPIHERINYAYAMSRQYACDSVLAAVEAGNLLIKQRDEIPEGQWIKWLAENCPGIVRQTAHNLMRAAIHVRENDGYIDVQTVRQLYIAAGILKEKESTPGSGAIEPEKTLISPFIRINDVLRLNYTDEHLDKFQPQGWVMLRGYIEKLREELNSLEDKLAKRLGAKVIEAK
jgi:hypothetical protein